MPFRISESFLKMDREQFMYIVHREHYLYFNETADSKAPINKYDKNAICCNIKCTYYTNNSFYRLNKQYG